MKKNIFLLSVLILTIFSVKDIRAEESQAPAPDGKEDRRDMMKGGMGKGMMHHQPSVVATSDGGVVVLDGPRLIKYDSQLTLIGEAELKPGKKRPQIKKEEDAPVTVQASVTDEPAIELPAVENPS